MIQNTPSKKLFGQVTKITKKYIKEHTAKVTDSYFEAENPNVILKISLKKELID